MDNPLSISSIPGLNIQWPWTDLILSGAKTVETRNYPLPKKHLNRILALIETPGPRGKLEGDVTHARIIALIEFSESFEYRDRREWLRDQKRHQVAPDSPVFSFRSGKRKFGWKIGRVIP